MPELPSAHEAEERARKAIYLGLSAYADRRIQSYETLELKRLLQKDTLMLAMRGVNDSTSFVDNALAAFESSSEEGMMGEFWQGLANSLSERSIDLSDLLLQRDGDLWLVEIKAQTNTVTGRFRNDLLVDLQRRVAEFARPRRLGQGRVQAMLGVIRGPSTDREVIAKFAPGHRYAGLNGFAYQYKVGRPFWAWLTGHDSLVSLIQTIPPDAARVATAREASRQRLHQDLEQRLKARGDDRSILAVMRLAEEQYG